MFSTNLVSLFLLKALIQALFRQWHHLSIHRFKTGIENDTQPYLTVDVNEHTD